MAQKKNSRKEIDLRKRCKELEASLARARQRIRQLEESQQWLPVPDKMPDRVPSDWTREVLITVRDTEDDDYAVYEGFYDEFSWWTQWCHGCKRLEDNFHGDKLEVVAWMPLPKPYRGTKKKSMGK